jgi:hypothetical protein
MARKPLTVRSAFISTMALTAGSSAGSVVATLGHPVDDAGQLVAAIVALWVMAKLDALVGEER